MSLIWINGALSDKAAAGISPVDHGLLYGDGVWEHFRLRAGMPFRVDRPMQSLFAAAAVIGLEVPLSHLELLAAVNATAIANVRTEGYVRVIVSRGPGTLGPDPRKIEPQVIVAVEEYQPFPQELYGHGLHVVIAPTLLDLENPAHRYRTLNQLHIVLAKRYALENGCLEALLRTRSGHIAGSTEGIICAVRNGSFVIAGGQPDDANGCTLAEVVLEAGAAVLEEALTREDLLEADEVFILGTACGVIGIVRIDGTEVGNGTEGGATQKIRAAYWGEAQGKGE